MQDDVHNAFMHSCLWKLTEQFSKVLCTLQSNGYNAAADHASWWALRGILLEVFGLMNSSNPYVSANGAFDYQTGVAGSKLQSA